MAVGQSSGISNQVSAASAEAGIILQPQHGEAAAPDAAGIQSDKVFVPGFSHQCGPVAKNHTVFAALVLFMAEPWSEAGQCGIRTGGDGQFQASVPAAKAHAGKVIGNQAQAFNTGKLLAPGIRLVAVLVFEKLV